MLVQTGAEMEFRLVQHSVNGPASGHDLLSPRRISFASEIPRIGLNGFERGMKPIRLRGVSDPATESFVSVYGAYRQGPFWVVARRDPFPFDLGNHLPRMAQRAIVPEIGPIEVPSSWHGRLESMMTPPSWSRLIASIWRAERVCYECGSVPFRPQRLEGHEVWEEDAAAPHGPTRRLVAIRMLCGPCMDMKHLGHHSGHAGFSRAFERLCAINRIDPRIKGEAAAYRRSIAEWKSAIPVDCPELTLDLSILAGAVLTLRDSIGLDSDGILRHLGSESGCIRVMDADISTDSRRVTIRPRGWVV